MRGTILRRALTAALLALAVAAAFQREASHDFHWHVAQGEAMLATRSIYRADTFSHTFRGHPVFVSSWLADVALAGAFRAGGYPGCFLLHALCMVALLGLSLREMARRGLSIEGACALLALFLCIVLPSLFLRPEMFALALLAGLLHALGEHERSGSRGALIAVAAIMAAWPNLHGSVATALLAVGFYAAERTLRLAFARPRDLRALAVAVALPVGAAAIACLNPEGIGAILSYRILSASCIEQQEWMALPLSAAAPMVLLALGAIVATTLLVLRRASPWRAALVAVLLVLTLRHRRFLAPLLVAALPLVAGNLAVLRMRLPDRSRLAALLAALVGAWGLEGLLVERHLIGHLGLGADATVYPEAACRYARAQRLRGRMFNSFDLGSYLLYCLPEQPVYIDQRVCSLYPGDFFQRYLDGARSPAGLRALADESGSSWAFVAYDDFARALAVDREGFRLAYFDDQALLYLRAGPECDGREPFRRIDPQRLPALAALSGPSLEEANQELTRQAAQCPGCASTASVRAALAIAAGDERAASSEIAALGARGESADSALLEGLAAERRGDFSAAEARYERSAALGGDPFTAVVLESRAAARAGDRATASRLLDEAAALPGGAFGLARARALCSDG